jgi:hypothetical protein
MKNFIIEENLSFLNDRADLINRSKHFLFRNGFKIIAEFDNTNEYLFSCQRGSELMLRLLGILLISKNKMPIKLDIKITKNNTVELLARSDMSSFGSSFGLENKFNSCLKDVIFNFRNECIKS